MTKVLLTGHKGFIGSRLNKKLIAFGIDMKNGNNILDCALPDVDVVIHLAAVSDVLWSVSNPTETVRNNVLGTVRLAERYRNTKFIFASTGGAIQDKITSPYGLSKYCAEEFIKMICSNYVILRFANVYGEGGHSAVDKFIQEDSITIYGDGSQTRTWVYADDIVQGIQDSIQWKKGLYQFGTDQNYTMLEIARATGKPIKFIDFKEGELKFSSVPNTTPGWQPTVDVIDYIKSRVK